MVEHVESRKNRLFAQYGHECELIDSEEDSLGYQKSVFRKILDYLMHKRIVSEVDYLSEYYLRSQGAIMREKKKQIKYYPYTIHPFSDFRKWWELLVILVLIVEFIIIPLDVGYFLNKRHRQVFHTWVWISLRNSLDCVLLVDVVLNFVTGYYDKVAKEVVLKPSKIARHYLCTWFVPHLISSVPTHLEFIFNLDLDDALYTILQLLSLLKVIRIYTFSVYWFHVLSNLRVSHFLQTFIWLVISKISLIHGVACLIMFVSENGIIQTNITQIHNHTIFRNLTATQSYVDNFYRSARVITKSHCSRSIMVNDVAYVVIIIVLVCSRIVMVRFLATLMEMIKSKMSSTHKYEEMVRQLREYMRHKQLPEYMQRRLLVYYEFRFQKSYFRESEILSTISGQLKQDLIMHSCRKLVENVVFFKNLPLALLVRIVSCLRSEVYLVNDVIVRAATPGNGMFFIATGTVAVMTSSGCEICHLEDGAHFGEIALVMSDELRVASVIAVEVCELYRLDRNDFVRAIQPYPDLMDNIQRIAADRLEQTNVLDEFNRRRMASRRLY